LVISPVRIIAPVGGEVVLLAGLRNPAGQFSPAESIEWILSQESVGHFVEVGQESDFLLCHWRHHAPRKLSNNYAVGKTARADQVITRGNANPADDVWVMRGQSWLSLSSPSEGVSRVTAVAPEAAGWDRRQQTAEVYWIDAQWSLPAPAQVRAGQPHALTTVVTRPGTSEPVAGWIVRYEVAGGSPASFSQQGDQAIDVVTDATGAATAQIFPQAAGAGATQVRIQIIRPGMTPHEPSRLAIGEGATTVSWSAPSLAATISGPPTAGVGTTLTYRIDVSNPGNMAATDVMVAYNAPPGIAILNSDPSGSIFGQRVEWRLGELPVGSNHTLVVNCRADEPGSFNNCVTVQSTADDLTADHCVLTQVVQPAISLNMTGPQAAEVGQQVQFVVTVRNEGGVALNDVIVTDRFDEGLEHAVSASPIEKPLGSMAPGEQKQFSITFRVAKPGRWCHSMTATTATGQTATAQACVVAREAPAPQRTPGITLRAFGPNEMQEGHTNEYTVEVENTGQTPLTAIRLAVSASASLQATSATGSDNRQQIGSQLVWTIERMEVGAVRRFQIICQATQPDAQAFLRAEATAREQVRHTAEAGTRIVAPVSPKSAPTQKTPPPTDEGKLQVTLADQDDPARAGQVIRYRLTLANTRGAPDQNVAISVTLPEYSTLVRVNGPTRILRSSPDGRGHDLAPILEVRAGETRDLVYVFEVRAQQPGRAVFRATITSAREPRPIVAEEETTVLAP
jgi:uncharacterized repeat protein (TIGR01451 family)